MATKGQHRWNDGPRRPRPTRADDWPDQDRVVVRRETDGVLAADRYMRNSVGSRVVAGLSSFRQLDDEYQEGRKVFRQTDPDWPNGMRDLMDEPLGVHLGGGPKNRFTHAEIERRLWADVAARWPWTDDRCCGWCLRN